MLGHLLQALSDPDGAEAVLARVGTQEIRERVETALRDVPEAFRTVVILREIEGFTYEEIADITDSPIGTVKGRLHRARREFIEMLRTNSYDWELPQ